MVTGVTDAEVLAALARPDPTSGHGGRGRAARPEPGPLLGEPPQDSLAVDDHPLGTILEASVARFGHVLRVPVGALVRAEVAAKDAPWESNGLSKVKTS